MSWDTQNDDLNLSDWMEGLGQAESTADLTPMLDTIFLIILLLLATLMNSSVIQGFPVNLPTVAGQTDTHRETDPIEISIDAQGQIAVGQTTVTLENLPGVIRDRMAAYPQNNVLLRADRAAEYGTVAKVLFSLSNQLSSRQVILVTDTGKEAPQ